MLVLSAAVDGDGLRWSGRRHDDDGPGASHGVGVEALFDTVFHALHDGEQVAVGLRAPLGIDTPDAEAALAAAELDDAAVRGLAQLLAELGRWRPWTVVSTTLPRWRATTSVLVWETGCGDLDASVEAFFALAHGGAVRGAEKTDAGTVNLAAAIALRCGLTVDAAQVREPVLLVSPGD